MFNEINKIIKKGKKKQLNAGTSASLKRMMKGTTGISNKLNKITGATKVPKLDMTMGKTKTSKKLDMMLPKQVNKMPLGLPSRRMISNLHPFKDTDGDGVMNWKDCRPLNKFRQDFGLPNSEEKKVDVTPLKAPIRVETPEPKDKSLAHTPATQTDIPLPGRTTTYKEEPVYGPRIPKKREPRAVTPSPVVDVTTPPQVETYDISRTQIAKEAAIAAKQGTFERLKSVHGSLKEGWKKATGQEPTQSITQLTPIEQLEQQKLKQEREIELRKIEAEERKARIKASGEVSKVRVERDVERMKKLDEAFKSKQTTEGLKTTIIGQQLPGVQESAQRLALYAGAYKQPSPGFGGMLPQSKQDYSAGIAGALGPKFAPQPTPQLPGQPTPVMPQQPTPVMPIGQQQGIPLPAGMVQKDDKIRPLTDDQRAVLTPEDIEIYERKIYYYPYPGETNDQTIKRILAEEAEKIKVEKQLKRTYSQDPAKRKKTVVPRGKYNTKRKKIAKIKRKIAKNIEQQQQTQ